MKGFLKAAAFAGLLVATGAQAADLSGPASVGGYKDDVAYSWWNAGDIFVRVRGEAVVPQVSSSGTVNNLRIDTTAIPEADISYFLTKNIAVEAICCVTPHQVDTGSTKIGDTTLFPPTVLLQYHFDMGKFKPYVGAGVNYTVFFDNSTTNGFHNLKLNDALGVLCRLASTTTSAATGSPTSTSRSFGSAPSTTWTTAPLRAMSISIRSSSAQASAIASARATPA